MGNAVDILRANGIKRPEVTIAAAREAGLELAVACAMLMGESGGGRMVWGSDGVSTGGTYTKGGPVTEQNYKAYRAAMKAGKIGRQGVGDSQLTSAEFQDRGDALGGCWLPYPNQLSGFIGLANRIRAYGLRDGLRRYNGSGKAAEAYATRRMAEAARWRRLLAGADIPNIQPPTTAPQEDDMTPEQARKLDEVHSALTVLLKPWPGGVSDKEPSKLEDPDVAGYNLLQYLLRNNVEIHQLRNQVTALEAKLQPEQA
jgi:hypothetical protein